MSDFAIETVKLTRFYGFRKGIENLSIRVRRGQIYGFIGPNGAGKTTTMRVLSTLLEPSWGKVKIMDHDLSDVRAIRSIIGYLPERTALYEGLSVSEYLRVFAYAYGLESSAGSPLIGDVMELLDLKDMAGRVISNLSKGMKQRVALARCLIHNPQLLLLDEPASGLDPQGRLEMRELLKELRRMGKTVFISSHVLSDLDAICDAVGIVEQGRLMFTGSIGQLRDAIGVRPRFLLRAEPQSALSAAAALPGVESPREEDGALVFGVSGGTTQADVVSAVVQRGGKVLELREQRMDLEQLFVQFTKGWTA